MSYLAQQQLIYKEYSNKLPEKIEAIIFDFDGVFTDNKVTVSQDGVESVVCSRGDGLMLQIFRQTFPDIPLQVISKEKNNVVAKRCEKLGIDCLHGIDNKLPLLTKYAQDKNISLKNIVYTGNDLNDLECIRTVGCGVAVADSYPEILDAANIILKNTGGNNAIREILEAIKYKLEN